MTTTPDLTNGGFSGKKTADIVGISYRQLDYWARTDLIRPSLADAKGSGSRRRYSYRDLLELKLVKTLLDNGIKLESIRQAFSYLRDQLGDEDVASARLVIAGNSAVFVHEDEQLIDVVNRYQGQGVLNLLALDGVKEELDAAIVEIFPGQGVPAAPGGVDAGDGAGGDAGEAPEPRTAYRPTGSSRS